MGEKSEGVRKPIHKVIRKRIRYDKDGVHVVGDVNAVISGNVSRVRSSQSVSSKQRVVASTESRPSEEEREETPPRRDEE